jgi:hypothetical protein
MSQKSRLDVADVEQAIQKAIAEAELKRNEPDFIGNRPAFILCQYLHGINLPEEITFSDLRPFVEQWYDLAEELFDEEPLSFMEVWTQFTEAWPKVKYPKSQKLNDAKERAKRHTEPLPELAEMDDAYQYLGMVCWELQQAERDDPFFLSSYDAGKILGKGQKAGLHTMRNFVIDGILDLVEIGTPGPHGRATKYRYLGNGEPKSMAWIREQYEQRKQKKLAKEKQKEESVKDAKAKPSQPEVSPKPVVNSKAPEMTREQFEQAEKEILAKLKPKT